MKHYEVAGRGAIVQARLTTVECDTAGHRKETLNITRLFGAALRHFCHRMQLVFQDPYSSFDPLATVTGSVAELMTAEGSLDRGQRFSRVEELLELGILSSRYTSPISNRAPTRTLPNRCANGASATASSTPYLSRSLRATTARSVAALDCVGRRQGGRCDAV